MVQELDDISTALMHLFYYQQGLFADEVTSGSTGSPRAGQEAIDPVAIGNSPGRRRQPQAPASPAATTAQEMPQHGQQALQPPPPPSVDELARGHAAGAPSAAGSANAVATNSLGNIRALRARRAELEWRLETGALRAENEALESQVLHMQKDFVALQEEFKDMKERYGEQLAALDRQLEAQQAVTLSAEKRVVCTEDLVRFHEEQRRLMAGHWKAQCQLKDERIRYLNLQLTEYTIDWQHLGTQKQTEASLSHELECLQDRHRELSAEHLRRSKCREQLVARLAESRAEAEELSAEVGLEGGDEDAKLITSAASSSTSGAEAASEFARLRELEATKDGLRSQLQLLQDWRSKHEASAKSASPPQEMPWPHSCIWRDELDVRERQLEKITAQLDKTNNALHAAQAALASQRLRHEEMKRRHREAEAELREDERARSRWRRECLELRRAEMELKRAVQQQFGACSIPAASSDGVDAVPKQPSTLTFTRVVVPPTPPSQPRQLQTAPQAKTQGTPYPASQLALHAASDIALQAALRPAPDPALQAALRPVQEVAPPAVRSSLQQGASLS